MVQLPTYIYYSTYSSRLPPTESKTTLQRWTGAFLLPSAPPQCPFRIYANALSKKKPKLTPHRNWMAIQNQYPSSSLLKIWYSPLFIHLATPPYQRILTLLGSRWDASNLRQKSTLGRPWLAYICVHAYLFVSLHV